MKIHTADNLTDEEIREAVDRGRISASLAVDTGARLSAGQWYAPADVRAAARARVAAILNTRDGSTSAG